MKKYVPTLIPALATVVLVSSCSVKTVETEAASNEATADSVAGFDENNYESFLVLDNYLVSQAPADSQIHVVDSTCALVIDPTLEQIQVMEEKYGEDFYTIADDAAFYQSEARNKFDSLNIKVLNANSRYVQFKGDKYNWILDLRKEGAPEWNIIFFQRNKVPEIVQAIDVSTEKIREYFDQ